MQDKNPHSLNNPCTFIYLSSFCDFLILKLVSNKEGFSKDIYIKQNRDRRQVFDSIITAVLFPTKLSPHVYAQLLEALREEGIYYMENIIPPQSLQNFAVFTSRVFGDGKYSLIKENFQFSNPHLSIAKHLFVEDEPYSLSKFSKQCSSSYDFWLVENKRSIVLQNRESFLISNSLIKLGSTLIINLHKSWASVSKLHNYRLQSTQLWAKAGKKLQFVLKLNGASEQDIYSILKYFNENGVLDYIEWEQPLSKDFQIKLSDMGFLVSDLQQRKKHQMKDLNITKEGFRVSEIDLQKTMSSDHLQAFQHKTKTDLIEEVTQRLIVKKYDILGLLPFWRGFTEVLKEFQQYWSMYEETEALRVTKVVSLLEYRLYKYRFKRGEKYKKEGRDAEKGRNGQDHQHFYLYERLYPQVTTLIAQFNRLLKRETIDQLISNEKKKDNRFEREEFIQKNMEKTKAQFKLQENILDKLMMDFISELDSIDQGKGCFYIKIECFEKKPLKDFIAQIIGHQQKTAEWTDVFNAITLNIPKMLSSSSSPLEGEAFLHLDLPDTKCLGCTGFFIVNQNIASVANRTPMRVFSDCSLSKLQSEIAEEVCFMLNSSGGVILFGIDREYYSVLPKGNYFLEETKKESRERVKKIISLIYPRIKMDQEVFVSFVPVAKDQSKEKQRKGLMHIANLYSMRIKVLPKDRSVLYLWRKNDDDSFKCSECMNKGKTEVDLYRLNRSIKERMKKYSEKKAKFRPKTILNHQCKEVRNEFGFVQDDPSAVFQNLSLIVVKQENIPQIENQLRRLNLNWRIQIKFRQYNFNIAKYTAVLYHNSPFDEVVRHVTNNPNLRFNQKKVLAIFITEYLKIQHPQFSVQDIKNAAGWLIKQFPLEKLQYYTCKVDINQVINSSRSSPALSGPYKPSQLPTQSIQHYIKSGSRISNLYLYFVFNHFKIKTIFKNPENPSSLQLILQQQCKLVDNSQIEASRIATVSGKEHEAKKNGDNEKEDQKIIVHDDYSSPQ